MIVSEYNFITVIVISLENVKLEDREEEGIITLWKNLRRCFEDGIWVEEFQDLS